MLQRSTAKLDEVTVNTKITLLRTLKLV